MATQEEIIQQYQEDRNSKLLQLENTLSSRISQDAKRSAVVIDGVSVVSTTYVASDVIDTAQILSYQNGRGGNFASEIRNIFEKAISSTRESLVYLTLSPQVFYQSETKISIRIGENLFLVNSDGTSERIGGAFGINESIDSITSFSELSKKLSSYSIPQPQLSVNKKFQSYLNTANAKLKSKDIFTTLSSFPVLVYSQILISDGTTAGQFTTAFPKPDGYIDGLVPTPPATPSLPSTPSLPATPGLPVTPGLPDTSQVSTVETDLSETVPQNGENYLSIEAVKNADPNIEDEEETSIIVSNVFIAKDDIGKSFRDGTLNAIKTNEILSRTGPPPVPAGDVNTTVLDKEKKEIEARTDTQRKLEESDAIKKEDPKEKSSSSPSGPSEAAPDGKEAKKQENAKPIPADKVPPESTKNKSTYPSWKKWLTLPESIPSSTDKFILNRSGLGEKPYSLADQKNNPMPQISAVSEKKKFKSLFDHGKNLSKFFSGYTSKIQSPIDVAMLCNTQYVGGFNKNVPYIFAEGSETQLVVIRGYTERLSEGILGTAATTKNPPNLDANWSENPYWCGLTVDFLLYANTNYISDEDKLPIVNTRVASTYFSNSPVNPIGGTEATKKRELTAIEGDITSRKKTINSITSDINKLNKRRSDIITKLTEIQADNLVNKTPAGIRKEKTTKIDLEKTESDIENKQSQKLRLENEIKELETQRERVNNTPNSKLNKDGTVAKFELGVHFIENQGLTTEGLELWEQIKDWQGAYIVRRKRYARIDKSGKRTEAENGHVELLLHFGRDGRIFVIFGNSSYNDGNRNGQAMDFKKYNSIGEFVGSKPLRGTSVYVVKRGVKSPYTNSISTTVIQTDLYKEYVSRLSSNDPVIDPRAYNILREIMEIKI